jgi:hypothetical protein
MVSMHPFARIFCGGARAHLRPFHYRIWDLALMTTALDNARLSSEGKNGENVTAFIFASEAIGMSAEHGCDWAQFRISDTIGNDLRYTIVRKLGWGMHSSTWLARDKK